MNTPEVLSLMIQGIAVAIPATFAFGAFAAPRGLLPRWALAASGVTPGLALLFTVGAVLVRGAEPQFGVRVDAATCVMLLLVCSIGLVIVRYSRTYLQGEMGLARYFRWLLLTLSAVTTLVIANNLLVVALAWTGTSFALHQLLTFYSDRNEALVAAHKKFLVSRLADACLLACLALVHANVGSLNLDRIAAWAGSHPELSPSMQFAAVLVVIAAALKSAQLPFHGWLTQVMEAPTPVSALLHAGVVNIGGFVLIRLSAWMVHAEFAQLLLVVIGLVSAIVAALVMTTRVSVKVALAWSTCAQMGFMLVQCGLGAWNLALLHLVAHSLYKAHAFLSAGNTVDGWRVAALTRRPPPPSWGRLGLGLTVALGSTVLAVAAFHKSGALPAEGALSVFVLALLVGLSIVPMLVRRGTFGIASAAAVAARSGGVVLLYTGWHAAAALLMPSPIGASNPLGWALVGAGFVGLFAIKTTVELLPEGRLARALHPWLFAGLYVDERFTRFTFRVWPPRLQRPQAADAIYVPLPLEVRP